MYLLGIKFFNTLILYLQMETVLYIMIIVCIWNVTKFGWIFSYPSQNSIDWR
jgi:hypothetical protein